MSTELFDKKLKSKLEQIQPSFDEQSWNKISKAIQPKKNWDKIFGWLTAAVMLLVSTIFIYQNNSLKQNNIELNRKITALQTERNNSLYANQNTNHVENVEIATKNNIKQEQYLDIEKQNQAKSNEIKLLKSKLAKAEKLAIQLQRKQTQNLDKEAIPEYQTSKKEEVLKNKEGKELVVVGKSGFDLPNTSINSSENIAKNSSEEKTPKGNEEDQFNNGKADSSFIVKIKDTVPEPIFSVVNKKPIAKKEPKFNFFMGVSSVFKEHIWGLGATMEFRFLKHFVASIGYDQMKVEGGVYKNERDFKNEFNEEFRDKFKHGIPPLTRINDIHITRNVGQVPIQLGYTFNIYKGLALTPNVGTRLNVVDSKSFNYKFSVNGTDIEESVLVNPLSPPLFNNITLGIGVQYEVGRFLFRAEPSYLINTQKNLPPNQNQGARKDISSFGILGKILFRIF